MTYMNAAATHAAFVVTISAASMYWLLRHAQHMSDINIHKPTHFPKKLAWATLLIFTARRNASAAMLALQVLY